MTYLSKHDNSLSSLWSFVCWWTITTAKHIVTNKNIQSLGLGVMVHCIRTNAKKIYSLFFTFIQGSFAYLSDNWWQELSLNTNYYHNTLILQISFLFFTYQLLLIFVIPIRDSCSFTPLRLRTKYSERITDGKTSLTMSMKPSLCAIAARSHLVFTWLPPCPVPTSCSARFSISSARTSLPVFVKQILEQLQQTLDYANSEKRSTKY